MTLRTDLAAVPHSSADKAAAAATAKDLDSMRTAAQNAVSDALQAVNEYKKALPAGHSSITTLATSVTSHF
jgi:hypothetical protein